MRCLKIGTRGSPLALTQTNLVCDELNKKGYKTEIHIVKTTGDRFQSIPLNQIGGKALFAKELQALLLNQTIDLAIHSLKDLETTHPDGLELLGVLKREQPNDVFITKKGFLKAYLYDNNMFKLGTCSPRRAAFAKHLWSNVEILPLRGNVESRIQKVLNGEVDATLLALAGLSRLNILQKIENDVDIEILKTTEFTPASCQGIIGIEGRLEFKSLVQEITHLKTYQAALIERKKVSDFGGNCSSAIGVLACIEDQSASVICRYIDQNGTMQFMETVEPI